MSLKKANAGRRSWNSATSMLVATAASCKHQTNKLLKNTDYTVLRTIPTNYYIENNDINNNKETKVTIVVAKTHISQADNNQNSHNSSNGNRKNNGRKRQ